MKFFLGCVLCVAWVDCVSAVRVFPFVYSFDPTPDSRDEDVEKKKEFTYSIVNKMDETIAFELVVFRRYVDKRGEERLVKDEDSFVLFPSQLIIPPHKERIVKFRWIGNDDLKKDPHREQAFRVSIKQFHINLNPFQKVKRGASVEFNIQVMTSLYMTPGLSKAVPRIKHIEVLPSRIAIVTVRNEGTRRANYNSIREEITLPWYKGALSKVLPNNDKGGSIQPGAEHEFIISESSVVAKKNREKN